MNNPKKKLRSHLQGFPRGAVVKESTCQCRRQEFDPCSGKTPHATGQLSHSYWACALEPRIRNWSPRVTTTEAHGPKSPCSVTRGHRSEKPAQHNERAGSTRRNYRKALAAMKAQHNQNKNKKHFRSQYHQNKILRNKLNKSGVNLHSKH